MFNRLSARTKKIIMIILFVAVVIFLGWLLYTVFWRVAPSVSNSTVNNNTNGQLPLANSGQPATVAPASNEPTFGGPAGNSAKPIQDLTAGPIMAPTAGGGGKFIHYYNPADGHFYRLDQNGNSEPLSDKAFYQAQKITWTPLGDKAVLEFPDQSKIIYDFGTKKQVSLPDHWQDFSFAPNGETLVSKSLGNDAANRWLITVSADGGTLKKIEQIGDNDQEVIDDWSPNNQFVALWASSVDGQSQQVIPLGANQENFPALKVDGQGFASLWFSQGDHLLYSVYSAASDYKPSLWVGSITATTTAKQPIGLNTLPKKCAFANDNLAYCAVPQTMDTGAGMFPATVVGTNDDIYQINLQNGSYTKIMDSGLSGLANLVINPTDKSLYFTDGGSQRLHKIALPQ